MNGIENPRPEPLASSEMDGDRQPGLVISDGQQISRILLLPSTGTRSLADSISSRLRGATLDCGVVPENLNSNAELEGLVTEQTLIIAPALQSEAASHYSFLSTFSPATKAPWLRAVIGDACHEFHVGPLFSLDTKPCYGCGAKRLPTIEDCGTVLSSWTKRAALDVFAAWIAEEALVICNGLSRISGTFTAMDMLRMQSRIKILIRNRRCVSCGTVDHIDAKVSDYQEAVEMLQDYYSLASTENTRLIESVHPSPIPRQVNPMFSYDVSNTLLPYGQLTDRKANKPERLRLQRQRAVEDLDLNEIADLLRLTAGYRAAESAEQQGRRWCPSAGNLGSVYLTIHTRGLAALVDGHYSYRASEHSLEPISSEDLKPMARNSGGTEPQEMSYQPALTLDIWGAYHKLESKYGMFAYKLVHLDIGVAAAQLLTCARGLGMSTEFVLLPDTRLDDIDRDPYRDRIGAVVNILQSKSPIGSRSEFTTASERRSLPEPNYDKTDPRDIERFVLDRECELDTSHRSTNRPSRRPWFYIVGKGRESLAEKSYRDVMRNRASVRHFANEAPDLDRVINAITSALTSFERYVGNELGRQIRLLLVAERVAGLDSGQYLCGMRKGRLKLEMKSQMESRPAHGTPAFRFVLLGRSGNTAPEDFLTFGQQLVMAGLLGQLLALETIAEGLQGCLVARNAIVNNCRVNTEDLMLLSFSGGIGSLVSGVHDDIE